MLGVTSLYVCTRCEGKLENALSEWINGMRDIHAVGSHIPIAIRYKGKG